MKPNTRIPFPPSRDSPPQSGDAKYSTYSYFAHEKVMGTFQGLPGPEFDQPFTSPTTDYSRNEGNNHINSALHRREPYLEWHHTRSMAYEQPKFETSYQQSPINEERVQSDSFIREPRENFACEYSWPQSFESGVSVSTNTEPGYPSGYLLETYQQNPATQFSDLDELDNGIMGSPTDLERLSYSHSPTMGDQESSHSPSALNSKAMLVDTVSCKASDDGDGDTGNLLTAEGPTPEAPYAKLIYRALMEAPNHSMVLQDIYQWFIDNTAKGDSASTGWRNSIRHNLSMNAAFRKTGRKSNGDDPKRTSEWVLEPFAIIEGVTPTTRYRKNGKKIYKSRNAIPSRARSSRSAGISTGKTKFQSQQCPDSRQDLTNEKRQEVPIQPCTPTVTGQPNLSPYTPDFRQPLPGSLYHSGSSFWGGWEQFGDLKSVQMDDGMVYMEGHEHYGDRYPYAWTDSQYY